MTDNKLLFASTEAVNNRAVTMRKPTAPPSVRTTIPPAAVIEPTRSRIAPSNPHSLARLAARKIPAPDRRAPKTMAVTDDGSKAKAPPAVAVTPNPMRILNAREPVSLRANLLSRSCSSEVIRPSARSLSMSRTIFMAGAVAIQANYPFHRGANEEPRESFVPAVYMDTLGVGRSSTLCRSAPCGVVVAMRRVVSTRSTPGTSGPVTVR